MSHAVKKQAPSRKQRAREPRSFADNESLTCVASPLGPIRTPVVSTVTKEIILERIDKEIVRRFSFSLTSPRSTSHQGPKYLVGGKLVSGSDERDAKRRKVIREGSELCDAEEKVKSPERVKRDVVRQRLLVGTNQCTRALEGAASDECEAPLLIILARDIYPPTILAHVPFLAKQVGTPIMLLPGQASVELGKVLGTKKVAVLAFLPSPCSPDKKEESEMERHHSDIDSFIDFAKTKLPT